jgi:hypothetical protein
VVADVQHACNSVLPSTAAAGDRLCSGLCRHGQKVHVHVLLPLMLCMARDCSSHEPSSHGFCAT